MTPLTIDGVRYDPTGPQRFDGALFVRPVRSPDGAELVAVRLPLDRAWRLWTEHDRLRVPMPGYEREGR